DRERVGLVAGGAARDPHRQRPGRAPGLEPRGELLELVPIAEEPRPAVADPRRERPQLLRVGGGARGVLLEPQAQGAAALLDDRLERAAAAARGRAQAEEPREQIGEAVTA